MFVMSILRKQFPQIEKPSGLSPDPPAATTRSASSACIDRNKTAGFDLKSLFIPHGFNLKQCI